SSAWARATRARASASARRASVSARERPSARTHAGSPTRITPATRPTIRRNLLASTSVASELQHHRRVAAHLGGGELAVPRLGDAVGGLRPLHLDELRRDGRRQDAVRLGLRAGQRQGGLRLGLRLGDRLLTLGAGLLDLAPDPLGLL